MDTKTLEKVIAVLQREAVYWKVPVVTLIALQRKDPFRVLVATVLSLRTKDEVTALAAERLFALADTPKKMAVLPVSVVEKAIYPVGFYKTKAKNILRICQILVEEYGGVVPDDIDTLLRFPNVGRKTANLVLTEGYQKPAVCVDVHNWRILNRLGYTRAKSPFETEMFLRAHLPRKYWVPLNALLVAFGQHCCVPVSPFCSRCPVNMFCERVGVERSR